MSEKTNWVPPDSIAPISDYGPRTSNGSPNDFILPGNFGIPLSERLSPRRLRNHGRRVRALLETLGLPSKRGEEQALYNAIRTYCDSALANNIKAPDDETNDGTIEGVLLDNGTHVEKKRYKNEQVMHRDPISSYVLRIGNVEILMTDIRRDLNNSVLEVFKRKNSTASFKRVGAIGDTEFIRFRGLPSKGFAGFGAS